MTQAEGPSPGQKWLCVGASQIFLGRLLSPARGGDPGSMRRFPARNGYFSGPRGVVFLGRRAQVLAVSQGVEGPFSSLPAGGGGTFPGCQAQLGHKFLGRWAPSQPRVASFAGPRGPSLVSNFMPDIQGFGPEHTIFGQVGADLSGPDDEARRTQDLPSAHTKEGGGEGTDPRRPAGRCMPPNRQDPWGGVRGPSSPVGRNEPPQEEAATQPVHRTCHGSRAEPYPRRASSPAGIPSSPPAAPLKPAKSQTQRASS